MVKSNHRFTDKQKAVIIQMGRGAHLFEYIAPVDNQAESRFVLVDSDGGESSIFQATLSILEEQGLLDSDIGKVDRLGYYSCRHWLNDTGIKLAQKLSTEARKITRASK